MKDAGHGSSLRVHGPRLTSQLVGSFGSVVHRDALPPAEPEVRDSAELWLAESGIVAVPLLLGGGGGGG
eukprot:5512608-Prymnesium_polylepis.1